MDEEIILFREPRKNYKRILRFFETVDELEYYTITSMVKNSSLQFPMLGEAISRNLVEVDYDMYMLAFQYKNPYSIKVIKENANFSTIDSNVIERIMNIASYKVLVIFPELIQAPENLRPTFMMFRNIKIDAEFVHYLLKYGLFEYTFETCYGLFTTILKIFEESHISVKYCLYEYFRVAKNKEKYPSDCRCEVCRHSFVLQMEKDTELSLLINLRERRATRMLKAHVHIFNEKKFFKEQEEFFETYKNEYINIKNQNFL